MTAQPADKAHNPRRDGGAPLLTAAIVLVLGLGGVFLARRPLLELAVTNTPCSALFLPFVSVSTKNLPARGRRTQIDSDLRNILTVAEAIYTDTGRWPESIADVVNALGPDGKPAIASLEMFPMDPWHHEYKYEIVDGQARVTCLGSDGVKGGEGEAADTTVPVPQVEELRP